MLYMTFFFTISLFLYGLFLLRVEKKERVKVRLSHVFDTHQTERTPVIEEEEKKKSSRFKVVYSIIWKQLKRTFNRKLTHEQQAKLETKLLQAGNPFGMTPVEFRLVQIALYFVVPLIFFGYGLLLSFPRGMSILLILMGIALASYLPHYYINRKVKIRHKKALKELPDLLDLLTVSLEAGLGFDGALSKVVSKKTGVLTEEFRHCLEEIRLGRTRREALKGIQERLPVHEVSALISSIIQAEKLGVGLVQVLRVQSTEVRIQKRQRAEEEAMKAPIKMLFPLVLFIFPSLFIVLLGPALIQFLQTFRGGF